MKLVVDGFGKSVSKRDNQIVIKEKGKEVSFFLAKNVKQVLITGKGSITFDALSLLAKEDIDCLYINWKGDVEYRLSPSEKKNPVVRKEQYFSLMDYRSGYLAKSFIKSKIGNQKSTLGTLAKSRENNQLLIEKRDNISKFLLKLDSMKNRPIDLVRNTILGIEGQASAEYWEGVKFIIPDEFNFDFRSGRYARDPVNAMLNYGYAILQSEVWKDIYLAGLDPYCGFLHSTRYGRVSLVFDLMEEFRQQIVDKTVISLINKKQVSYDDFEFKDNMVIIGDKKRKLLISSLLDKLSKQISYNGSSISYSDIILNQSRNIAKFLENNEKYEGFYLRW